MVAASNTTVKLRRVFVIKCVKCGFKGKDGIVFCGACGNKVNKTPRMCPHCSQVVNENARFCGRCGASTVKPDIKDIAIPIIEDIEVAAIPIIEDIGVVGIPIIEDIEVVGIPIIEEIESEHEQVKKGTPKNKNCKKKKWVIGPIVTIIIVGVLGITMANTIIPKVAPDKYVLLSMAHMKKLADKDKEDRKRLQPENKKLGLGLSIDEINGLMTQVPAVSAVTTQIEGVKASFSRSNSAAQEIMVDVGFEKKGLPPIDVGFYSTTDVLGLRLPILDHYLMIDLDEFIRKYDQSSISGLLGEVTQEDIDLLNLYLTQGRKAVLDQGTVGNFQFHAEVEELYMNLITSAHIGYVGKAKATINNKVKSANQFSIVLDSDDVTNFIKGITRSAIRDTDLLNKVLTYESDYLNVTLEKMIYDSIDNMELSDVEITCIIDHKMRIVNTDLSTSIAMLGDRLTIGTNYTLSGAENIFDTIEANLIFGSKMGDVTYNLAKDKTYSNRKTKILDNMALKIMFNNMAYLEANYNLGQDTKATQDNFILTSKIKMANATQLNASFNILGDLIINKKDKEYSLVANNIELIASGGPINAINIRGSGYRKIENLQDQSLAIPANKQTDLFNMTGDDLLNIGEKISSQLQAHFLTEENLVNIFYQLVPKEFSKYIPKSLVEVSIKSLMWAQD